MEAVISIISVKCGEGWITWDNSCYRQERSDTGLMDLEKANSFCGATHKAGVFVPNSKDESEFISMYLTGLLVRIDI